MDVATVHANCKNLWIYENLLIFCTYLTQVKEYEDKISSLEKTVKSQQEEIDNLKNTVKGLDGENISIRS